MQQALGIEDVKRLYQLHGPELRQALARLAPELDSDDLLQEVFLVVLHRPQALAGADSARAWLFGVAVKLAATRRRSARLRRFFGLASAAESSASVVDSPSRTVEQRDAQRAMGEALGCLSEAKRSAFVLFELQGLSGDEVAEALGIPLKTVWTRLFHARREVVRALERQMAREARTSGLPREEILP